MIRTTVKQFSTGHKRIPPPPPNTQLGLRVVMLKLRRPGLPTLISYPFVKNILFI